jgi:hypothetical protein
MSDWDALHFPSKRAVKELNATLAELAPGSFVTAYIRSDSYGPLAVTGAVTAGDPPTLGAHDIGVVGKPARDLWRLELHTESPAIAASIHETATLVHGDLVRATFRQHPYAEFTIMGIAVAAPIGTDFLLGSWLLTTANQRAPRLLALEVIAKNGKHDVPIPPRMTVWPSNRDSVAPTAFAAPTELQLELDSE